LSSSETQRQKQKQRRRAKVNQATNRTINFKSKAAMGRT
jgi:hypothetical protein